MDVYNIAETGVNVFRLDILVNFLTIMVDYGEIKTMTCFAEKK